MLTNEERHRLATEVMGWEHDSDLGCYFKRFPQGREICFWTDTDAHGYDMLNIYQPDLDANQTRLLLERVGEMGWAIRTMFHLGKLIQRSSTGAMGSFELLTAPLETVCRAILKVMEEVK